MLRIAWAEYVTNEEVLRRTGVQKIVAYNKKKKETAEIFGQIMRKE